MKTEHALDYKVNTGTQSGNSQLVTPIFCAQSSIHPDLLLLLAKSGLNNGTVRIKSRIKPTSALPHYCL